MEGITLTKLLVGLVTWVILLIAPVLAVLWVLLDLRRGPTRKVALMKVAAGALLIAIAQADAFPLAIAWFGAGLFAALVGTADLVVAQFPKER
jgi:hypothetical protein